MTDVAVLPARGPVRGTFAVPPSKSLHQRALVLAALSDAPCGIVAAGGPVGDDATRLAAALAALGPWRDGALGTSRDRRTLDLGLGATGFRFAIACATLRPAGARTLVRGRPGLLRRPHGPLLRAVVRLGGHAHRRGSGAVRVVAGGMHGGDLAMPASASSQHASALLLVGPRIGGLALTLLDRPVSAPYLGLTFEALRAFGVTPAASGLDAPGGRIVVPGGAPHAVTYAVPPDASAAAAWWAAAALTGGDARVEGLGAGSSQPDVALLALLERAGAAVTHEGSTARVRGGGALRGLGDVDLRATPDLLPLAAAIAAVVEGETRLLGVAHARTKETDRIETVARGLAALGADVAQDPDGLRVRGRPGGLLGAPVDVRGDHRLAFAFGVLGLVVPGVVLRGGESAAKSHPSFLADLARAAGGG